MEKRGVRDDGEKSWSGVQIQSVERAIQILNCFRKAPELGVSEIAAELGLSRSTVFGQINTLTSHGFLEQVSSRKYRLGIVLFELGNLAASRIDLRYEAKATCTPLAEKYHVVVHIAVHNAGEVIYIDKIDSGDSLISASSIGKRCPMHCTGVGKAMLAFLPREYLERYVFCAPLQRMTENTITDKEQLLQELWQIRRTGIAIDREEIERGLTCVATPILDHDGLPQIAISLSFPYGRIQDVDTNEVCADLRACAQRISTRIGSRAL